MSLPGTIAITDYGWYDFLRQRRYWEEVNFWTPSAHWTFRAPEFSPFLFKLKAPHNAIAGFGYLAPYSALPDRLAWECFGEGNGCATFEEMQAWLAEIRRRFRYVDAGAVPQIGCIIVVNASFFSNDEWIPQPSDWPVRTPRPTRYDLAVGEGTRVWSECLARVRVEQKLTEPTLISDDTPRYGAPILVRPRLGQGAFRVAVTDAYSRACAVPGEHSLPAPRVSLGPARMALVWRSARSAPNRSALERRPARDRALSFRRRTHHEQRTAALVPTRLRSPLAHAEFQRVSPLAQRPGLRAGNAGTAPPQREVELVVIRNADEAKIPRDYGTRGHSRAAAN